MRIKYTRELLEPIVAESLSVAQVIQKLGLKYSGGNYSTVQSHIKRLGIDRSHFLGQGHNKGKQALNKKNYDEILVLQEPFSSRAKALHLRRALIESGREYCCELCGINKWNNKELVLHVHHVNGKYWDHRSNNLQFLCPNCHSQTPNFGGQNSNLHE